jgi:prevent-host-death family protein
MQINIAQAKARLSELVQKAMLGEEVIIAKDNRPLLRLVPIDPVPSSRKPGSAKNEIISVAKDFDQTPDVFDGYR